jgi:hypothetical protein
MIGRCVLRYVLTAKRDDERVVGGKTYRSREWGSWDSGVFSEIETARDVGNKTEVIFMIVSPLPRFINNKKTYSFHGSF